MVFTNISKSRSTDRMTKVGTSVVTVRLEGLNDLGGLYGEFRGAVLTNLDG